MSKWSQLRGLRKQKNTRVYGYMSDEEEHSSQYMVLEALQSRNVRFVNTADEEAIEVFRNQNGNKDLLRSTCFYSAPVRSSERGYPLYFRIASNDLEACRITAGFYSAIKASKDEIWHQIQRWARRNAYKDYPRLKAIVTSAIDNPCLCDCQHPLLQRFCPAGKCFMAELIEEYESPRLFDQK